jgi:hypothetical protein
MGIESETVAVDGPFRKILDSINLSSRLLGVSTGLKRMASSASSTDGSRRPSTGNIGGGESDDIDHQHPVE